MSQKYLMAGQTEHFKFEERSVIKFLVAEKCKPCEIYRRMCDVFGDACFSKNNVYKWAKLGFATSSHNQKRQSLEWKYPDF